PRPYTKNLILVYSTVPVCLIPIRLTPPSFSEIGEIGEQSLSCEFPQLEVSTDKEKNSYANTLTPYMPYCDMGSPF
ncbi:MAG TPA: hypothetical protein VE504_05865, partial [Nitrososphaeraceae archaeon]|nr:hypothetical protein [Nitrososphaeraceae archaeon]